MSYLQTKWRHTFARGPYYPYFRTEAFDYEESYPTTSNNNADLSADGYRQIGVYFHKSMSQQWLVNTTDTFTARMIFDLELDAFEFE